MFNFKKSFGSLFLAPNEYEIASDEEAIAEVWKAVGKDISKAMELYEQETKETHPPKDNS